METQDRKNNNILNKEERSSGKINLQSTPPNVIFSTSYTCNMKCIFCFGKDRQVDFNLDVYRNAITSKLPSVIRNVDHLYHVGWGEILLLPKINEFIDYLNKNASGATKVFTTNGVPLSHGLILKLMEGNYSLQISLHASNPLLHCLITGTESFEQIVSQIKYIVFLRKERKQSLPWLTLIFVITALNIENLPDFVDFAGEMGVNAVVCHYLTIYTPEHVRFSCFFLQETTNRMFNEAEERARKYSLQLVLPPQFNIKENNKTIEVCTDPWTHIIVDMPGNILPCCFAGEPIGNLNNDDFMSIWNGKEYSDLRESLVQKKPHQRCRNCLKYNPLNNNDIRSHITNRVCQKDILKSLGLNEEARRSLSENSLGSMPGLG